MCCSLSHGYILGLIGITGAPQQVCTGGACRDVKRITQSCGVGKTAVAYRQPAEPRRGEHAQLEHTKFLLEGQPVPSKF